METAIKQSHQQQDCFSTSVFVGVQVKGLKWHTCLHTHTHTHTHPQSFADPDRAGQYLHLNRRVEGERESA